jgi:c-di-GMP-binding flagellar brake protein YcgR
MKRPEPTKIRRADLLSFKFFLTLQKKFSTFLSTIDPFEYSTMGVQMSIAEKEAKPRYGIANFERRTYRRFPIRLPIEYYRADLPANQPGQALDASEGGLQILFPEQVQVGQNLKLRLFFSSESQLNTIEMLVQVVWVSTQSDEDEKHYRSGVKFINISPEDMTKLKTFSSSFL